MKFPKGPFGCILADPPWAFRTRDKDARDAVPARGEQPYKTMKLEDMKAMSVQQIAAPNCALFMWSIDTHLEQSIELAHAWGFKYKTRAFTWRKLTNDGTKTRIGMGYWTRKETEFCLLFSRGLPKPLARDVREIIDAPRREHSRKPDEQYDRIERLVAGPYIELFSRSGRKGWAAWGDETGKFPARGTGQKAAKPATAVARRSSVELLG